MHILEKTKYRQKVLLVPALAVHFQGVGGLPESVRGTSPWREMLAWGIAIAMGLSTWNPSLYSTCNNSWKTKNIRNLYSK